MLAVANFEADLGSGFTSGTTAGVVLTLRGSAPNGITLGALFCASLCSSICLFLWFDVAVVKAIPVD